MHAGMKEGVSAGIPTRYYYGYLSTEPLGLVRYCTLIYRELGLSQPLS
jgi:hypothetical protein